MATATADTNVTVSVIDGDLNPTSAAAIAVPLQATYTYTCSNLQTGVSCAQFFTNQSVNTIAANSFSPFTTLLVNANVVTRNGAKQNSAEAYLVFLDQGTPVLPVVPPTSLFAQTVNTNDELYFVATPTGNSNSSTLLFSIAVQYQDSYVATQVFTYFEFTFTIWNVFNNFV